MPEQWLTYRQLGELWNTTPEAARLRSRRANYPRRTNEQGTAEVLVDAEELAPRTVSPVPDEQEQLALPAPYTADSVGAPFRVAMSSLSETDSQVSALLQQLTKAEEQVEILRRSLEAERQQVSKLMAALLRRSGEKKVRRGWFFWRRADRTQDHRTEQLLVTQPDKRDPGPDDPPDNQV